MDLFLDNTKPAETQMPLAARMRPQTLEELVGQKHIVGENNLLYRAIKADRINSIILYGPPGSGKNCLAFIISNITKSCFQEINAVASNVSELRDVILSAKNRLQAFSQKTILFVDEIHRFNKAQQDILMPCIEKGELVLIGATTHNPFFSIIAPLLSRSLVFELKTLSKEEIKTILNRALKNKEKGLGNYNVLITEQALDFLSEQSEGDARRALNALEIGIVTTKPGKDNKITYDIKTAQESIQKKAVIYDKNEDSHYDTISAFIKSMRGSDPDAALYWLAKMLYAGEDPRFIARRIVICASEDVGNADPRALMLAGAALQVSEFIGMPEARIPLAQAVAYIACAPKSNAAYLGIEKALKDVEQGRTFEVPAHLQDTHYKGAQKLGRGVNYKYSHDHKNHYVKQDYMPSQNKYYQPTDMGYEKNINEYLKKLKKDIQSNNLPGGKNDQ